MSEIKFDLNAWKEANELINEQLTEYLTKKNLCEQWKYLMDEESTFGFFDPDSSEYVWKTTEVYRKLYMGDASHWMFWDMFDFENLKREKNRLVACAKRSNEWDYEKFFDAEKAKKAKKWGEWANRGILRKKAKKWGEWADRGILRIAGETDINFKKDRSNQKYAYYKKLIEKSEFSNEDKEKHLCKLAWCERRFHSLENFSLMLVPGELNNVKGNSRDRMDRFIWLLNGYFEKRERNKDNSGYDKYGHKLFSKAKGKNYKKEYQETCLEVIYEYLSLFEDVYDYCGQIYKMDAAAVKRFLASGEKERFKTGRDVVEYMQLAEDYWKNKHNFIFHT
jgi:hypothetical protein